MKKALDSQNLAILIIDMSDSQRRSYEFGTLEDGWKRLMSIVETARSRAYPLFATEYGDWALAARLRGLIDPAHVIPKPGYSAFKMTDLDKQLKSLGVNKTLVTGFNRDCCVRETSSSAKQLQYDVITCPELMFATPDWHERDLSNAFYHTNTSVIDTAENVQRFLETGTTNPPLAPTAHGTQDPIWRRFLPRFLKR